MKRYLVLLSLFILAQNPVICQSNIGYKIEGVFENLNTSIDTLILGYYQASFDGKTRFPLKDTAILNSNQITFQGKDSLEEGVYFIYNPKEKNTLIDLLLITKQRLYFNCNMEDLVNTIRFKDSKENTLLFKYFKYSAKQYELVKKLRNEKAELDPAELEKEEELNQVMINLQNAHDLYVKDIITKNSETFLAKFLKTRIQFRPNPAPKSAEEGIAYYNHIKNYFLDKYDFSDERILRTPNFAEKMKEYISFIQGNTKDADSINVAIDILVKKTSGNKEMFRFVIESMLTKYQNEWRDIMGMDGILVHLADYVMQGLCPFIEGERKNTIIEEAKKSAKNLIGSIAPEFSVQGRPFMNDTLGNLFLISDIKADYTFLVFYAPDCGHCKKRVPKIKAVYDSLINVGMDIKTLAITTGLEEKEWRDFIKEYELVDWINIGDRPFKVSRNYIWKIKKSENTFVSLDKKQDYEKGTLKQVSVEEFFLLQDTTEASSKILLNIPLLKQVTPKYKNAKFILNDSGDFICTQEEEGRRSSEWQTDFGIKTTPYVYILDKEKRIRGKGLQHYQIGKFMNALEEMNINKK